MERIFLAKTVIDISGCEVEVELYRTSGGAIEWIPVGKDKDILEEGGYLDQGTVTEAYGQDISIYKYEG